MIRNIIFDWSGTLVDDLPAVWAATNHVFAKSGRPEMTLEQFRAEFCLPFTYFYDKHTPHVPLPQLEEWFHAYFKESQHLITDLPHARDFLCFCQSKGIRMFVLSTIHEEYFVIHTKVNGFGPYFEKAYLAIRDKRAKIGQVLFENNLDPNETLFIGDMQHDIDTARHGGVHSCGVLTGYNGRDQLRASKPDLIVQDLRELYEILDKNGMELVIRPELHHDEQRPISTVGALIYNAEGKVLMVRTNKWSNLWGIPGGKIEYGETSIAALRREIMEETALDVADVEFAMVQDCIRSAEFCREAHFVLLNYTCRVRGSETVKLNEEAQEFEWVTVSEAKKLKLNTPTRVLLEQVHPG